MITKRFIVVIALLRIFGGPATWAGNEDRFSRSSTVCVPNDTDDRSRSEKKSEFKAQIAHLEKRVGLLRKHLEQWGSVTVSAPLVMREAGEFNLGKDTDFPNTLQYINLALTSAQGGVSQSTSTAFSNQLDLTVTPTFSINPLTGEKQVRSTNTDSSLTPDSVANGTSINLTSSLAPGTAGGTAGTFAPPGSLIVGPNGAGSVLKPADTGAKTLAAPSSFSLSGSQAALIGENAKISEMLMRTMADPPQRLFTNPSCQIHFAIVQVSCNPGWRTKENYIADVSATCEYFNSTCDGGKGKVTGCVGHNPLVFSVLPLIDAQTLELQNSERRLTQLAASLAAAYPTAAANLRGRDLMQFVKQFQKDTQTVTPRTVANSYSSGPTFGFRLMPSLTALKDPARSGSKPANILQATSFPVLVTVVLDMGDPVISQSDSVRVSIANRWLVNENPKIIEFWRCIGLPLWRDCTGRRVDLAMDYDEAQEDFDKLKTYMEDHPLYTEAALTLDRDLHELRHKVLGVSRPIFCLPLPARQRINAPNLVLKRPAVQRILPNEVTKKGSASLFISGLNFFLKKGVKAPYVTLPGQTDTSGIDVLLGQNKGTVLLCNGDDQLVVRFDKLEELTETDVAPLIIRTDYGAIGWGQAVKLKAADAKPSTDPQIKSVELTDLVPDDKGKANQFTIITTGANLGDAKAAKLKSSDTGVEIDGSKISSGITRMDGTKLLVPFTVPDAALGKKVTLELYKDDISATPLAKIDFATPKK